MRTINKIIIHCTATPLSTSVKSIRNYHLSLGYMDIAYHYIIDSYGFVHNGRPVSQVGAHCRGHNSDSIGIALIGGLHGKFDFTHDQLFSLYDLITRLRVSYNISLYEIYGHNDFTTSKTCPNFNVKNFFAYEGK